MTSTTRWAGTVGAIALMGAPATMTQGADGIAPAKTVAAMAVAAAPEAATVEAPAMPAATDVFNYGRFGAVSIYRGRREPHDVVLFVSGDGGWNLGVVSMAQRLVAKGAVVAGIDIRHYLAELERVGQKCVSPAADFENLSHYLQMKLRLKTYLRPTLVGYSSGATLAYATLAESPEGLFKGALSIGFCPDLDLKKPVCPGSGIDASPRLDSKGVLKGVNFLPAKQLPGKWISLQGETDQVCPAAPTQKFIAEVPGGEIVMLPKVGHGYSVEKNWVPQYEAAYERITAPHADEAAQSLAAPVSDLPLIVVPADAGTSRTGEVLDDNRQWFGVLLTGDGGWVSLDKGVAAELVRHDIPIVGWDSLKYFWSARTPEGASKDLDRVLRHFSRALDRPHALLIGYSQGADTLPFMVNRLPADTREMVGLTVLMGISDNAVFEFHVANWLGEATGGLPTAPEIAHWSGSPYLCLYGANDADAACKEMGHDGRTIEMRGGHHFGGRYKAIADKILSRLPVLVRSAAEAKRTEGASAGDEGASEGTGAAPSAPDPVGSLPPL